MISGEDFGGWFELGAVQLLGKAKFCERQGGEGSDSLGHQQDLRRGCQGDTRTVEGALTMGRAATSVASMVTLPGRLLASLKLL